MADDNRRSWFMPRGEESGSTSLNTRIMIIAIISLSSVILLVLALHIYARCVLARRVNRRRAAAIQRLVLSQSQPGHPQSRVVIPKPGLDPAVVAALPIFKFKNLPTHRDEKSNDQKIECSVCLSMLEDEEMVRQLPNCKHAFHVECIDKWLEFNTTCPLCRAEAEPRITEPSAPPAEVDIQPISTEVAKSAPAAVASTSRLNSFRRMLSRDRSSRRIQPSAPEIEISDVERQ